MERQWAQLRIPSSEKSSSFMWGRSPVRKVFSKKAQTVYFHLLKIMSEMFRSAPSHHESLSCMGQCWAAIGRWWEVFRRLHQSLAWQMRLSGCLKSSFWLCKIPMFKILTVDFQSWKSARKGRTWTAMNGPMLYSIGRRDFFRRWQKSWRSASVSARTRTASSPLSTRMPNGFWCHRTKKPTRAMNDHVGK